MALKGLYEEYNPEGNKDFYPWRLALSPATGLPAFLRKRDAPPFSRDDGAARGFAWGLLRNTLGPAIFGASDQSADELAAGPIIKLGPMGDSRDAPSRHFTWRQYYGGFPVIGGGARVHEVIGDPRVSVTSSFFPVADAPPKLDEQIPEDLLVWRALLTAIATLPQSSRFPFVLALIEQFTARWQPGDLSRLESLLSPLLGDGFSRLTLKILGGLVGRFAAVERRLMTWGPRFWNALQLDRRTASAELALIYGKSRAILPFDGVYHLICRVRLAAPADDPWYVDVDVTTGQALGEPWQAVAHTPDYYKNSGEAMSGGKPTGVTNTVALSDLGDYVSQLPTTAAGLNSADVETTTVAVHARRLLDHLLNICGVQPDAARLKGYSLPNGAGLQTPGVTEKIGNALRTGFVYDETLNPKVVRFQQSGGSAIGALQALAPAKDPEVIMHEFVHGFLWLLDAEPWDTPPTLNPFARALHEGYAMYLARSLAARDSAADSGNPDHLWARAAYPKDTWNLRWAFERALPESGGAGADYLPAPNSYPFGSYSVEDIRVYDVGMVWARALWDLRQLVTENQADWLAVQAYPYLHGYIANFELAAEGMLDVDIRRRSDINLANGMQPLWANRGIVAGQGVRGIAQVITQTGPPTNSPTLIAGTDAGILVSTNDGSSWTLEIGNGAPTGIVAVAAAPDQEVLYAAVQMPVTDAAGVHSQWEPAVYRKNLSQATPIWQPIGTWPSAETPLCLSASSNGDLIAGTTRGAQKFPVPQTGTTASGWGADQKGIRDLAILGLASDGEYLWGCSPTWIARHGPDDEAWQSWDFRTPVSGAENILTCIATWNNSVYVGTMNGAWQIKLDGTLGINLPGITEPVLALASSSASLYLAVGAKVYCYNNPSNPTMTSLTGLPTGATVISLFVTASGILLAGTLAHGILRQGAGGGLLPTTVQMPAAQTPANPISLQPGERALLSFVQPEKTATSYKIELSQSVNQHVNLRQVVQPGFPLQLVKPNGGTGNIYTLNLGPVILVLENLSFSQAVQLTLMISVPASGMIGNVTISVI